ncbi:helix-turn-helix domain-containing protein [Scytonema sp. PCC 10023]|uniref:helix-turn-helix domain-containing protein n=1 Tax=Scytonema sp. PCC 10023 TaxID=1680591 RepID=UPI0039C5DCCB
MFSLTYEFKLKPTAEQAAVFADWLEQCRQVYNYALAERKDDAFIYTKRATLAQRESQSPLVGSPPERAGLTKSSRIFRVN